jgi:hypothetical protein
VQQSYRHTSRLPLKTELVRNTFLPLVVKEKCLLELTALVWTEKDTDKALAGLWGFLKMV